MAPVTLESDHARHILERAHRMRRYVRDAPGLLLYWHMSAPTWDALRRYVTDLETGEGATMAERQRLLGIQVVRPLWMLDWDIELVIHDAPA